MGKRRLRRRTVQRSVGSRDCRWERLCRRREQQLASEVRRKAVPQPGWRLAAVYIARPRVQALRDYKRRQRARRAAGLPLLLQPDAQLFHRDDRPELTWLCPDGHVLLQFERYLLQPLGRSSAEARPS